MRKVPIKEWKRREFGTCPSCLYDVMFLAVQYGNGWYLVRRCYCRQNNDQVIWPFAEDSSHLHAQDFIDAGLDGVVLAQGEDSIPFDLAVEERYQHEEDAKLREHDHGWEGAFYDTH